MSNAVIFLHPEGYTTSGPALMGRHSAGESFLRGYMRYAQTPEFQFWNFAGRPQAELDALVAHIQAPDRPINWIARFDRAAIARQGVLNMPLPDLGMEAWSRRASGQNAYAICGVTHTTATGHVQNTLADLLIAPTESHDALICTSTAVRDSVEEQLGAVRDYLKSEYGGGRRRGEPQRVTIPLGVNAADFTPSADERARWRAQLGIEADDIAVLYVGRFNLYGKMNPLLMALALEGAQQRTRRKIHWIQAGWADNDQAAAQYHDGARRLCPSIAYHVVDGRPADTRFSIWSAADLFISFSDNIQETFGLTPVEAMAAGLPCVVTDWNGYRDTVRDGVDGFRVPTRAPRPGLGEDLAFRFAAKTLGYDQYVGVAAQMTAIDYEAAIKALLALIESADLRKTMGEAAARRAREVFDWSVIIPQYEALWKEMDARRKAYVPGAPPPAQNPWRLDPFTLFRGYPTAALQPSDRVSIVSGFDWAQAHARMHEPLASFVYVSFPGFAALEHAFRHLERQGEATVADILGVFTPPHHLHIERALLWMTRIGILKLTAADPGA